MNTKLSKPAASPAVVRVHRTVRKSHVRNANYRPFAEILILVAGSREAAFTTAPELALHTFPSPDSEDARARNPRRRQRR